MKLLLCYSAILFLLSSYARADEEPFKALVRLERVQTEISDTSPRPHPATNNLETSKSNISSFDSSKDNISNSNDTLGSKTLSNTTNNQNVSATTVNTPTTPTSVDPVLPHKGAAEEERHSSMAIFFVLSVIGSCILLIHFILETKFQYIPESLAVVFLGAAIGLVMKICSQNFGDWKKEETLNPTMFFLVLLPPIMYESGYTLHKGNFFQNIGSILVFAIIGTSISAFVIGGGVYILGIADVAYKLSFTESFAFGSLISAVDPVATLAIFHALNLDPILNMLVFGESIMNDAVAIVLATTALEINHASSIAASGSGTILNGFIRFFIVFFGSAFIGVVFALIAALIFKYVDLRKHPSLEFGMMLIFIYAPYGLAEGLHLSGIMAILFNGVVMSHYAHFNLSPVTQITMQQTLRTLAFIAETCVFAYLGLAIFSFHMKIELSLIVWSIILCLIGRAANIYPLSFLCNYFREHKISKRMMFVMWFSGLRGAIAYALALHLDFEEEKRRVVITSTLIIVLFTIIILGGSSMPMLKYMNSRKGNKGRRRRGSFRAKQRALITLSKTKEMGQAIETEHLSELTEEEFEVGFRNENNLKGFVLFDARYLMPFFTRRFTEQEVKDCKSQMTDLTNRWYETVRRPDEIGSDERDGILSEENGDEDFDDDTDGDDLFDLYQSAPVVGDYEYEDGCYADDEEARIDSNQNLNFSNSCGKIKGKYLKASSSRQSLQINKKERKSNQPNNSTALIQISNDNQEHYHQKSNLLPMRNVIYKKNVLHSKTNSSNSNANVHS